MSVYWKYLRINMVGKCFELLKAISLLHYFFSQKEISLYRFPDMRLTMFIANMSCWIWHSIALLPTIYREDKQLHKWL